MLIHTKYIIVHYCSTWFVGNGSYSVAIPTVRASNRRRHLASILNGGVTSPLSSSWRICIAPLGPKMQILEESFNVKEKNKWFLIISNVLYATTNCWILIDWCGVWPELLQWYGFCWWCLSPCWTARAYCSHIGDNNCKWSSIPRVRGELAEDKGTSFGLQGGYAINHQGSGSAGRHGSRGVCLPWLSYPLINRKHLWHQLPKCHLSCCHAELRKSDLEVTARHLNEVEAVQHVHLTNIPVCFGLLGGI